MDYVTFRTQAMGLDDTEHIYSDPQSGLPLKIERDVSMWMSKEYLVEHYDQKKFLLTIDKFKDGKKVIGYVFQEDGLLQNAILLPFYLRTVDRLDLGWEMKARFPDAFTIRLGSFEEVTVPAGTFMTYHFTSEPAKFEIWISKDDSRVPVKIKGQGGLGYTMVMKEHLWPGAPTERTE